MTTTRPLAIAIIGGGFSGTLMALQLMPRLARGDTLLICERQREVGRGQAYASPHSSHLLNVRAANMSAFPDEPEHFVAWLRQNYPTLAERLAPTQLFVSRRIYGEYVQALLADALTGGGSGGHVALVRDEVVALDEDAAGVTLLVASGGSYRVDVAVLASGNLPPDGSVGAYRGDPWAADATLGIPAHDPVLLIGSGLTMVDTVLTLLSVGHQGPIHALSRRGLLPHAHVPTRPLPIPRDELPVGRSTAALTRWMRARMRDAARRGIGWQDVMDGLRPHVAELWRRLPEMERRRFLRHLRPYWDIHRHRLAPAVAEIINAAIMSGQLVIQPGRLQNVEPTADHADVTFLPRGGDRPETRRYTRVINCSGPATNFAATRDHLLRHLLATGQARQDALRLGLDVTDDRALLDIDGSPSHRLWAVGPVTRGVFWECVAVPDIRLHCAELAAHLLDLAGRLEPEPAGVAADGIVERELALGLVPG